MNIIKKILVAGVISLFLPASSFAEKVKIGDPGWTGATAIANLLAAVVIDKTTHFDSTKKIQEVFQ